MNKVIKYTLLFFLLFSFNNSFSQKNKKDSKNESSLYSGLKFRSVGPAFMSGRIAEIAINPENENEWYVAVGSGGAWKTVNAGTTWEPLTDNQSFYSTGSITIDPNNTSTIWLGTGENVGGRHVGIGKGVFVTKDGGKTWKNKGLNNSEHISKIIVNKKDSNIVFVASQGPLWSSGGERGLYKSIDGGSNWNLVLSVNEWTGVTDVVVDPRDENIMYAATWQRHRNVAAYMGGGVGTKLFKSTDGGDSWRQLKTGLPTGKLGKIGLAISEINPDVLYAAIELDRRKGAVYRSSNGGESWKKMSDTVSGATGPHYYQELVASPHHFDKIYLMDVRVQVSDDGGKTFYRIGKENVHADHHDLWINPNKPGHLINGNDGGVNITYDDGKNWIKNNSTEVGQFYAINVDYEKPYNVYGGLQDNGVWKGPHNSTENKRWNMNGKYPWEMIMGGDGMEIQIDNRNSNTVYTGFQFGFYYRLELDSGKRKLIKPVHELGESPYRFNWQTPILLSPHNQDVLYFGTNHLHKSENKGDNWQLTSRDLTSGGKKGNVPYGTITTITESPLVEGLLYVGSDDGLVHISKNGGKTWKNISKNLPKDMWVSKVYASSHNEKTVYVSLNGYRWDNFSPFLFKSDNYGKTWASISSNLPDSPINVVIEDNVNKNILYIGNDHGVYASLDSGINWEPFSNGLNSASVHDLVIQKDENHLLVGTHGRSIYLSEIEKIQSLSSDILKSSMYVFPIKSIKKSPSWGVKRSIWSEPFQPNLEFSIFSSSEKEYNLSIIDSNGNNIYTISGKLDRGLNFIDYNLKNNQNGNNDYIDKGFYKVLIISDKDNLEKEFEIK